MSQTRPLPGPGEDPPRDAAAGSGGRPGPEDLRSQRAPDELYRPYTRPLPDGSGGSYPVADSTREVPAVREDLAPPPAAYDTRQQDTRQHDTYADDAGNTYDTRAYDTRDQDTRDQDTRDQDPGADGHGEYETKPWVQDPPPPLPAAAIPAARTPLSTPPVAVAGILLAIGLLVAAAALTRDFLVENGTLAGPTWTHRAAEIVDGMVPRSELTPLGLGAALVGLVLVLLAFWPRRRTHVPLAAASSVYVRPGDVDELATSAAEAVPGVLRAESKVSGRKVKVTVTTGAGDVTGLKQDVQRVVQERLAALSRSPRVKVKTDVVRSSR